MKFNTDDVAYFNGKSKYAWNLSQFQKVIIKDFAVGENNDIYYSVIISENETSSWYIESDLLTEKEYRKVKIININEKIT